MALPFRLNSLLSQAQSSVRPAFLPRTDFRNSLLIANDYHAGCPAPRDPN